MKKFRKIMAVLVAAIMVVAMTVPAWATEGSGRRPTTGSITIKNAEDGETYGAYKILDLYSFTDNDIATGEHTATREHYAYMIEDNSPWKNFILQYSTNTTYNTTPNPQYFVVDLDNPYVDGSNKYYFVSGNGAFDFAATSGVVSDEEGRDGALVSNTFQTVQAFARAAREYAATTATTRTTTGYYYTGTNSTTAHTTDDGKIDVTFSSLPLGYYLVDSTVGTMVALDTTNTSIEMVEKNNIPSMVKQVMYREFDYANRNETNEYASKADWFGDRTNYEIGDTVKFLTTITVPKASGKYSDQTSEFVLHDVMEKGFTLTPNSVLVYATQTAGSSTLTSITAGDNKYTVTYPASSATRLTTGESFTVAFDSVFLESLPDNATIEVEYTAKLNENAFVYGDASEEDDTNKTTIRNNATNIEGGPARPGNSNDIKQIPLDKNTDQANTNSAILTFGVGSATEWDAVTVETYQLDVVKTKEEDVSSGTGSYDLLQGAKFKLYRSVKDTTKTNFDKTPAAINTSDAVKFTQSGQVLTVNQASGTVEEFETDSTNELNIRGLEAGTYYLKETYAPNGFQVLDGYFKIVVHGDAGNNGTIGSTNSDGQIEYEYVNSSGDTVSGSASGEKDALATVTSGKYSTTSNGGVHVINKTSTELPSTGGMGTTVLYIVGGMLVILAGAYLFFSRKRTA